YDGADMLEYLKRNAGKLVLIDGEKAMTEIGSPKVLNMVMLGAAVATGLLPFTLEEIEQTMKATVKPQFAELNSKALRYEG
ncbi:MAG: 2-oxoacid:acceptor oxidoreductase family protein, partial [Ruminiclostridium sp.]|nr:2-oxoacid:acceptor oxidoreductase family protein [Ruminiclostridium sp.]